MLQWFQDLPLRNWLGQVGWFLQSHPLLYRSVARVAQEYNAYVLADDSDFLLLNVRGIVLIQPFFKATSNPANHPLRIYISSLIYKHTGLTETGFFYVCMLQNNDYISYSKPTDKEKPSISFDIPLAIEYVKKLKKDNTMKTYLKDYKQKHPVKAGFANQFIQKYSTNQYPVDVYRFIHVDTKEAVRLMAESHLSKSTCCPMWIFSQSVVILSEY